MPSRGKAGIVATLALIALSGTSTAVEPASGVDLASRIDDAIRFRSGFALRDDREFVERSFSDVSFDASAWGVPLSQAELAELDRRLEVRQAFEPLLQFAASLPGYAGAYTDHDRGGLPVLMTSEPDTFRASLAESPDASVEHEVRDVRFSLAELEALQETISQAKVRLESSGLHIVSIGLNPIDNLVTVGLREGSPEVVDSLKGQYGEAVEVITASPGTFDACTSMESCWPMKGGLRVRLTSNPGPSICTAGFIARTWDDDGLGVVTAGHCLAIWDTPSSPDYWGHASSPTAAQNIGQERLQTWFDNSDADVGFVKFDAGTVSALGSYNAFHHIDPAGNGIVFSVRPNSSQIPNDPVCRMGWGTFDFTGQGRTCGKIKSAINVEHESCDVDNDPCWDIKHQWEVNFDSRGGDSGGPVYQAYSTTTSIAYGTHVHSLAPAANTGWYSPIDWGRTAYLTEAGYDYSYDICITVAC